MDAENAQPLESRPPTIEDLVFLCQALNAQKVKYIIIGGMAIIRQGFVRTTEDIDLLVDAAPANQRALYVALEALPDKAVLELEEHDLQLYQVVRIADEFVVDVMLSACGLMYEQVTDEIECEVIDGISIPFASTKLLLKLKDTLREKDKLDAAFLISKLHRTTS